AVGRHCGPQAPDGRNRRKPRWPRIGRRPRKAPRLWIAHALARYGQVTMKRTVVRRQAETSSIDKNRTRQVTSQKRRIAQISVKVGVAVTIVDERLVARRGLLKIPLRLGGLPSLLSAAVNRSLRPGQ